MPKSVRVTTPLVNIAIPARGYVAALIVLLASGCTPAAPSGQVLASVDGQEITARDVQAEIGASNAPPGDNVAALAPSALSAIIDRKLVAAEGKKLGLEKSPGYLAMSQRSDEVLLGQATLERWSQDNPAPSESDIQKFIAANPFRFSGRALVPLTQFRTGPTKVSIAELGPLKTMAEVQSFFQAHGIPFETSHSVADTARLPAAANNQLRAAAGGEPLVERQASGLVVTGVGQVTAAPLPDAAAHDFAIDQLKRADVQERIANLRRSSKIQFQKGFDASAPAPH